jgi:hypothetical protein
MGWTVAQLKADLVEVAGPGFWLDGSMLANSSGRHVLGVAGGPQPSMGRYVMGGSVQRAVLRAPVHACRWPVTTGED